MSGFDFNNTIYQTPVTASFVDDSAMNGNSGSGLGNVLAIIAESKNLPPFTPVKFSSYREALAYPLDPSETVLLKALEKAFAPSAEAAVSGPDYVWVVNPRSDSQASLVLKDVGGIDAVNVHANLYGSNGQKIYLAIAAGTLPGTVSRTVTIKNSNIVGANNTVTASNIISDVFTISYAGSATVATVQTVLLVDVPHLQVTVGTQQTNLSFAVYSSVGGLLEALNQIDGVTAVVKNAILLTKATDRLDAITTAASLTASGGVTVRSLLDAVITAINTLSPWLSASRTTAAVLVKEPAVLALKALTYSTSSSANLDQWQMAFDALKNVPCHWLTCLSDLDNVHQMLSAHVNYMSDVAFQERRGIVGIPSGSANDDALAKAEALNNPRVSLVHQGFYDLNSDNLMAMYPPMVLAALLAGMMCGVTAGTPLTNKTVAVSDMASRLRNPEDTDVLLPGGVLCCWRDYQGNVRVLQSVSTSQNADNFNQHEMSTGVASDYVARALREAVALLLGAKNTPYLPAQLKAVVASRLKQLAIPEPLGEGVIVGDNTSPAWRGLTVTQALDSNRISVQVSPVIPNNYIGISIYDVPYTGTRA